LKAQTGEADEAMKLAQRAIQLGKRWRFFWICN
jgi:hypothetical protein